MATFDTYGKAGDYTPPVRPLHPLVDRLRRRRHELGISQTLLAKRLGYTTKSIKDWEAGVSTPSLMAFSLWAEALNLSISFELSSKNPA